MIELFGRGCLERVDLTPLGIDSRHDVLDRSVFSRRIHRLKNQQEGPAILSVEFLLKVAEACDSALEPLHGLLFGLDVACVTRIDVAQSERSSVFDSEWSGKTTG